MQLAPQHARNRLRNRLAVGTEIVVQGGGWNGETCVVLEDRSEVLKVDLDGASYTVARNLCSQPVPQVQQTEETPVETVQNPTAGGVLERPPPPASEGLISGREEFLISGREEVPI